MISEQVKRPPGRPCVTIDWQMVNEELQAGSKGLQIADKLGIHHETFYRHVQEKFGIGFTDYAAQQLSHGDDILRKAQFDKAIGRTKKGDTTLLMHLGRTRLKQVDAQPEKITDSSPNDSQLNYADAYIKAEAEKIRIAKELEQLKEELNALKSQTNPVLQRSDQEVQHLGRSGSFGENLFEYPQTY